MTAAVEIKRQGIAEIRVPAKVSPRFEVKFQPINEKIIRMIMREISAKENRFFVKKVEQALKKVSPKKLFKEGFADFEFCDSDLGMLVIRINLKKLLEKMKLDDWKEQAKQHFELTKKKLAFKKVKKW